MCRILIYDQRQNNCNIVAWHHVGSLVYYGSIHQSCSIHYIVEVVDNRGSHYDPPVEGGIHCLAQLGSRGAGLEKIRYDGRRTNLIRQGKSEMDEERRRVDLFSQQMASTTGFR